MKEENVHPERKYDVGIIIVYILFAITFFFENIYDVASIIACVFILFFLDLSVRKTPEKNRKLRIRALLYGFSVAAAIPCALKIVEIMRHKEFQVDALGMILTGIALTSIYFLIVRK